MGGIMVSLESFIVESLSKPSSTIGDARIGKTHAMGPVLTTTGVLGRMESSACLSAMKADRSRGLFGSNNSVEVVEYDHWMLGRVTQFVVRIYQDDGSVSPVVKKLHEIYLSHLAR